MGPNTKYNKNNEKFRKINRTNKAKVTYTDKNKKYQVALCNTKSDNS